MRLSHGLALLGAGLVSGCVYTPVPREQIRLVDSPAEVSRCTSLGTLGEPVRTDGKQPLLFNSLVTPPLPSSSFLGAYETDPSRPDLAGQIDAMRDTALSRGANTLLLTRRILRDWSYVQGTAYRCRH